MGSGDQRFATAGWLSYREERALERALSPDETRLFAEIARRIAAILILVTER